MSLQERVFLFLQGPSSPLFRRIAIHLRQRGHHGWRINICAGDWMFWRGRHAVNYRGTRENWPGYVERFMVDRGVSDLVVLGEERPYHKMAIERARALGVDVFVVEMGYLRPDWIALERGGMSTNSHFPNDPEHILAVAAPLPEIDFKQRHRQSFIADAAYDLLYNLPNVFLGFLFPHYRRHAIYHPLAEYGGWIASLMHARADGRRARQALEELLGEGRRYFLYPLQLQTDYQIRAHSPFAIQQQAIDRIVASFARHGEPGATLVVKRHPLDNGLVDWRAYLDRKAEELDLQKRIVFLAGGDLDRLIGAAQGVVTVNSTVGIHALRQACPVKVLGTAVFDMNRLTDQQGLDDFWQNPQPPDPGVCAAFLKLLATAVHVRGNFYSWSGSEAAAKAIARRLDERSVNEPGAYVDPPPRRRGQ